MPDMPFYEIDLNLAKLIRRLSGSAPAATAAALASRAFNERNICVELKDHAGREIESLGTAPDIETWRKELLGSGVAGGGNDIAPLILDGAGRLYLMRYFRYEQTLAQKIKSLAAQSVHYDTARLRNGLEVLFPDKPEEPDWQKVASITAVTRGFSVITGGPGTGKTSTVARILALLLEQDPMLKITLAAPTGKAAKRLGEAVTEALDKLDCDEGVRKAIPTEAQTLHRLIGFGNDPARIRYNENKPLNADIAIVDEASMVSLPLMSRLAAAMKKGSRLILLGDKDQLSSVDAGFVLGDICDTGGIHQYSKEFSRLVEGLAGYKLSSGESSLQDSIVELRKNYRFSLNSGIGRLSSSINDGGFATEDLKNDDGVVFRPTPGISGIRQALAKTAIEHFTPYLAAKDIGERLGLFNSFRVLCALREGPYGVYNINAVIESILASAGLLTPRGKYYDMMPVMITRNDYTLRLFNGDIGIVAKRPDNMLEAWFAQASGNAQLLRNIPVTRLPENEPVFAMTVHKSQGSEFDHVLLILPEKDSEVLTKELLYTGITRARKTLEIWAHPDILKSASARPTRRTSGLRDALWKE
jgi:exodeoxyribonuclease V alpha subunit